jgi:polyisoprenoid-binding protein YceI
MNHGGFYSLILLALIASPAGAAHWTVNYARSRLGFTAQWSGQPLSGEFKRWTADIDFDPDDLAHARVSVAIDLASEASDETDFDGGLKGAEGLATSRFPTARFVANSFAAKSANNYLAAGTLTIRGVSRKVALPFSLTVSGGTAHAAGTAHILRTDFGVGQGEWAAPTPVSHDVAVTIDLTATK